MVKTAIIDHLGPDAEATLAKWRGRGWIAEAEGEIGGKPMACYRIKTALLVR